MGSNKRLITSATGFPGTNKMLRFIGDAIDNPATALAMLAGKRVILSGVELVSGVYSSGWVAIDGEILPFTGGAYQANITITETVENDEYDYDGNGDGVKDILPAYKTRTCGFGTGGVSTYSFGSLMRLPTIEAIRAFMTQSFVVDSGYVHTDNNFTNALRDRLNGLVSNVQADWNATMGLAAILNKPNVIKWLLTPRMVYVGDVYTDTNIQLTFPDVGTSDYIIVGHLVSYGSEWNYDNDVIWMAKDLTATGFKLLLKEVTGDVQNLRFKYGIIGV